MSPLVRRSILKTFLIVVSCTLAVVVYGPLAWAQRAAGGGVQIAAPPMRHVPISSAPSIHAPLYHPPISSSRSGFAPSTGGLRTGGFRPPRRPIRPFPSVLIVYESPFLFGQPFWGLNSCWATCDLLLPWTLGYNTVSSPGPTNYVAEAYAAPEYDYGEERPELPQLFLKDGTILNVTDYWLVDDQLHFTMIEQDGAKPVEHLIPFDALDLQTTVDANTRRGFHFMLRNEPVEQYLGDHPEGAPAGVSPRQ
jgi:hypothetical protein